MLLDELATPVILAPLAGGPSTPELAAAVSGAGGLGFVASGYLTAQQLRERMERTRSLGAERLAVNLFHPGQGATDPSLYTAYLARLSQWGREEGLALGEPRYSDDDWEAKLELLTGHPAEVVSFTFGCPSAEVIQSLRDTGSEVWVTVTSPQEGELAAEAGADALVVQGAEAGGHRGSFLDDGQTPPYGLLPLLALVRARVSLPLIATGGIATAASVAAVISAGARAAQIGTGFMLAPEAGTSPAHRRALRSERPTVLTRAFTGRLARGIVNEFILTHEAEAPSAYPELHYVTAPMRARAREQENAELINLWAGEAHRLAMELPAAEIVRRLSERVTSARSA